MPVVQFATRKGRGRPPRSGKRKVFLSPEEQRTVALYLEARLLMATNVIAALEPHRNGVSDEWVEDTLEFN